LALAAAHQQQGNSSNNNNNNKSNDELAKMCPEMDDSPNMAQMVSGMKKYGD
jgi:hypothetical protein